MSFLQSVPFLKEERVFSQRCASREGLEPASFCADDTNGDIRNDIGQRPNWCEQAENHNHEHGECEETAKLGPLKGVARLATVAAYIITTIAISIAAITA